MAVEKVGSTADEMVVETVEMKAALMVEWMVVLMAEL